jgi:hypothetical protein
VQHEERPDGGFLDQAHLQIARAAAQLEQQRIDLVRFRQQALALGFQGGFSLLQVGDIQHLHLPDHLGSSCGSSESAAGARQARHEGSGRHHRGFFDHHRHGHFPPIDEEMLRHAQWQGVRAHHVLDHVIGLRQV